MGKNKKKKTLPLEINFGVIEMLPKIKLFFLFTQTLYNIDINIEIFPCKITYQHIFDTILPR